MDCKITNNRFKVLKDLLEKRGWECHTYDLLNANEIDIYLYIDIQKRQVPKLFLRSKKKTKKQRSLSCLKYWF